MYRASFYTLGCRLNQTETAVLAGTLKGKGYSMVEWGEPCDLAVINTCSVTEHGEARCRNVIRQALRRSPNAFVVVTGCYAQVGLEALRQIPGIDMIVGHRVQDEVPRLHRSPTQTSRTRSCCTRGSSMIRISK